MLTLDEALVVVLNSVRRVGAERVDLTCAAGRILAEDAISDIDIPPFNKAAMDGYACRRQDLSEELTVVEVIGAGVVPRNKIGPRLCAKIMTGSVIPEGADCVIMLEDTQAAGPCTIRYTGRNTRANICSRAEDIRKGQTVLRSGCRIRPQHIAVLASIGCVKPLVSAQPRVGIIATGDELVEPCQKPPPGRIRNSNAFQLAAQVEAVGAAAVDYGIAADTEQAISASLAKALAENDVVILSGGVSVGDYDLVKQVLRQCGVELLFEKVAVKPGRPIVFGIAEAAFCFGLPGNPVSTFVMFELLIKPFLCKMIGHDFKPRVTYARLEKAVSRKKPDRDAWLPVVFTQPGKVAEVDYHGSAHINALCEADGLICVPAGVREIKEGTEVAVRQI